MNQADALKILAEAAKPPARIEKFKRLAEQLDTKWQTVYSWWYQSSVPHWRLAAFDNIKKKQKAI